MATQRVQLPISFSYPQNVFVSSSSSSFVSESATLLLPASGVTITVIDRNTSSPTSVFAASTGGGTLSPVVTDAAGNVPGFVIEGSYTVQAAASGSFSGASVNWEAVRGDGVENIFAGAVNTAALATGAVTNATLSTPVSQALVPAGSILDFGGVASPSGWVLCDGSIYSQSNPTFTSLFGAIGNTWNTGGEGTGNFRVPDLRGRTAVGAGSGGGLTARALATRGGEETHVLSTTEIADHAHDTLSTGGVVPGLTAGAWGVLSVATSVQGAVAGVGNFSPGLVQAFQTSIMTNATGSGIGTGTIGLSNGHNNMQPYAATTKIIKL